jgi:hypothetical protein
LNTKEAGQLSSGDVALNVASIVLAFFSAAFACYMVTYGPGEGKNNIQKVTVALEPFDSSQTKLGDFDTIDPIVTGSIAPTAGTENTAARRSPDRPQSEQRLRYSLRSVAGDTAFVDVSNGRSVITLPVRRGALLPGVGQVLGFELRRGKWVLVTTSAEISQEGVVTVQ